MQMKVGDLVRRKYYAISQRQIFLKFNDFENHIGIVTDIDEVNMLCTVLFNNEKEQKTVPLNDNYLEIISTST
jgi:hypothetical protein